MMPLRTLTLSLALLTVGTTGFAQTPRPASPAPETQTIALQFDKIDIQRVARSLTEHTHKSVLLDGSVKVSLLVSSSGNAATMEEALDRLTKPLGLTWKKVYLMKSSRPPSGERVAQLVET